MSEVLLVDAMVYHAVALDEGDAESLASVAARFAGFGTAPLSVEVWCQLAKLHEVRGDSAAASLASAKATLIRRATPMLRTPATRSVPKGLTGRELDVVVRAVEGGSSRELAAALFLSPRTVENHLASAYRKLGLGGRDDLAVHFADLIAN
jgi:DNA-binding CsgD family transcriptional regulator